MGNIEDNKNRLQTKLTSLQNLLEELKNAGNDLSEHYTSTYANHSYDEAAPLKSDGFEQLKNQCIDYFEEQIAFIEEVLGLEIFEANKYSNQMKRLLSDFTNTVEAEFPHDQQFISSLIYDFRHRGNYAKEFYSLIILSNFSDIENNVVLIGGNGSGKSILADLLKGNDRENISVIPAQKSLYFTLNDSSLLQTSNFDIQQILLENNISRSKSKDDFQYFQFQNNQFTKLIIGMKGDYYEYLYECTEKGIRPDKNESVFGKLQNLFHAIFPEIKLHLAKSNDYLYCSKDNSTYHVNSLSEGEKAVLYYSISVLMAKDDSFIVVDEPETYLNPSLANTLWDMLIHLREDCQFIFITHSIDFVLGRNDAEIMWIKDFKYPDSWTFERVADNFKLPNTLLTEVLGSKKPIIFCEGNDKSSLDYQVYQALFSSKYTVIPVGGHMDVIKYCDVLSKSEWLGLKCKGIIDGDYLSDIKRKQVEKNNIVVIPFNEIEMLLVSDEVITSLMKNFYGPDAITEINNFKSNFWKLIDNKSTQVALTKVKTEAEFYIQTKKIEEFNSFESIEECIRSIANFDLKSNYDKYLKKINEIIKEENYNSLLEICNLKKEISRGLANKHLDSNFERKAIQHIISNKTLQHELKNKYFPQIT